MRRNLHIWSNDIVIISAAYTTAQERQSFDSVARRPAASGAQLTALRGPASGSRQRLTRHVQPGWCQTPKSDHRRPKKSRSLSIAPHAGCSFGVKIKIHQGLSSCLGKRDAGRSSRRSAARRRGAAGRNRIQFNGSKHELWAFEVEIDLSGDGLTIMVDKARPVRFAWHWLEAFCVACRCTSPAATRKIRRRHSVQVGSRLLQFPQAYEALTLYRGCQDSMATQLRRATSAMNRRKKSNETGRTMDLPDVFRTA